MSHEFFRGLKFAIPMGLILWALLLWAALAVAGCGSPVLITATDPNPAPASAPPAPPPAPPATAPSPIRLTGQIQAQSDLGGRAACRGATLLTHALRPTRSGSTLNGSAGTGTFLVRVPARRHPQALVRQRPRDRDLLPPLPDQPAPHRGRHRAGRYRVRCGQRERRGQPAGRRLAYCDGERPRDRGRRHPPEGYPDIRRLGAG